MELTQAQLKSLQALTVQSGNIKSSNLAVGEQLLAKVVSVDVARGEISLQINNAVVTAKTLLQLTQGQTIQLTVAQANANKVILQLPQKLLDALLLQNTQQTALREALPKQQPLSDAIIQIKALIQQRKSSPLPEKILAYAKNFIQKLPTPKQLSTAEGVKQAIQQSGVLLEKNLSNHINGTNAPGQKNTPASQTFSQDVKALFLGLKTLLSKEQQSTALSNKTLSQNQVTTSSQGKQAVPSASQANTQNSPLPTSKAGVALFKILPLPEKSPLQPPVSNGNPAKKLDLSQTLLSIAPKRQLPVNNSTTAAKQAEDLIKVGDKRINQVLNNVISPQKINIKAQAPLPKLSPQPPLAPLPSLATGDKTLPTPGGYKTNNTEIVNHNLNMAVVKSQNVTEVTPPRMNNLIDLIETLIKQVDSAISRTQVHQLNTGHDQEANKLAMSLEIPVNDEDNVHLIKMHIEKKPNQDNEHESIVTVNLALDLDSIGPVYARITLIDENTQVVFWAERNSTFALVDDNINQLHTRLEASGLVPQNIVCHHGQPPHDNFIPTEINNNLLDVRA